MAGSDFVLTTEEIDLLNEIYDIIPFRSIERGHAYFKNGKILNINRQHNALKARIEGTHIYDSQIDLDEGYFQCSCPAAPPCKHLAALIIWALQNKQNKDVQQAVTKIEGEVIQSKGDCKFAIVINDEDGIFSGKKTDGTLFQLRTSSDLNHLNEESRNIVSKLLPTSHQEKISFARLMIMPLRKIIQALEPNEYPEFYPVEDTSEPILCGGFIECRYLFKKLSENDYSDDDERYALFSYFYHPILKEYHLISPYYITNQDAVFFISERQRHTKEKKEISDYLIREENDLPLHLTENKKVTEGSESSWFYFLTVLEKQSTVGNNDLFHEAFTITELYKHRNVFDPILPKYLKKLFDDAWTKGPVLAISLYFDETEEKNKVKGKVEFVYAQQAKHLKPKKNSGKKNEKPPDTSLVSDDIFDSHLLGFPANFMSRARRTKFFDTSHEDALVLRAPKKERILLEAANLPFSYRKKEGKFAYTTRFLKKFAMEYLPSFKEKKILLRLDESLIPAVTNLYQTAFNIEGSSKTDWFQGRIEIKGLDLKDTKRVLSAYRKKEEVVKLTNGQWFIVDQLNIDSVHKTLANIGIRLNKDGVSSDFNRGQLIGLEETDEMEIRAEKKIKNLKQTFKQSLSSKTSSPLTLSASMEKQLRSYQKEGVSFFSRLLNLKVGGILADDMGLGKTIQTIAFIESIMQSDQKKHLFLVVCPMAALSVWEVETQKFAPDIQVQIWHGTQRKSKTLFDQGIVITTYMTLAQDVEKVKGTKFTCIFIDEAQNIKNVTTRASKCIRELQSDSFFCLTGTPVENYLSDLWSLLDICFPGLLGTKQAFKKAYGSGQSLNNHEQLIKRINPFILRRRKQEVLRELPKKSETLITLPLHDSQIVIYEKIRREAITVLKGAGSSYLIKMLPYLMRLRRVCCHPDLNNEMGNEASLESSKLVYLKSKIPEIRESSSGVLVFSQFTGVLKKVAQLFDEEGVEYFYLDGSTIAKKRKEFVERFQNGEKEFFLISLKAGGTALTLHRADTVFHLDPWWNPASENQATDRVHRIGQKRNVFVYKLIAKDTIEEKVISLQKKKQELFDTLFNEKKNSGQSITKDELMNLLETA